MHIPGNNSATVPLPSGTFTQYLLVLAEMTTASGTNGVLPVLSPGSGFTLVDSNSVVPPPNFAVYKSASGTSAPILSGNDTKGRWTAVVLGFSTGTTVTPSPIASAATSPISVAATTAVINSTWVFVGSVVPRRRTGQLVHARRLHEDPRRRRQQRHAARPVRRGVQHPDHGRSGDGGGVLRR